MKIRTWGFSIFLLICCIVKTDGQIQPSFGGGAIFYSLRSNRASINRPLHLSQSNVHRTNALIKANIEWPKKSIICLSSGIGYSGFNFSVINSNSSRITILAKTQHLYFNGMLNFRGKSKRIFKLDVTFGGGWGLNSNILFRTKLDPDPEISFPNPRLRLGWILNLFFEAYNLKFTFSLARELERMTNKHFIKKLNWQSLTANYSFEF